MTIPLTERVQASIIALQAYREWLWANKIVELGPHTTWDREDENKVRAYWKKIRPDGTDGTDICFFAAKRYPISDTLDTEEDELPQKFEFGW